MNGKKFFSLMAVVMVTLSLNSCLLVRAMTHSVITFDANGGVLSDGSTRKECDSYFYELPNIDATKDGFAFVGWYKEREGINRFGYYGDKVKEDMTLYAKWTNTPLVYTKRGDSYSVLGVDELIKGDISIDSTHNGLPVTEIEKYGFKSCRNLTSITIPSSIKKVHEHAFDWCEKLTTITGGEGITTIGDMAFRDCEKLSTITLGSKLTTIGSRCFERCESLVSIKIPSSVTSIGAGILRGCEALTTLEIDSNNKTYKYTNGVVYTKDGKTLVIYLPINTSTSFAVENGIEKIASQAFADITTLKQITFPNTLREIGSAAFSGCENLQDFVIPASVEEIGSEAFMFCNSITSVTIPGSVHTIRYRAFDSCYSLDTVVIETGVTAIDAAFLNCNSLKTITIPKGLIAISEHAIPDGVKIIRK